MANPRANCTLCKPDGACVFHRARTPSELARALLATMRERNGLGVASIFAAGFCGLEDGLALIESTVPGARAVLDAIGTGELRERFGALVDQSEWTTSDLRELASVSLALAVVSEYETDEEVQHATQAR